MSGDERRPDRSRPGRRRILRFAATTAAIVAAALTGCAAPPGGRIGPARVIDLTHALSPNIPIYPGGTPLSLRPMAELGRDGYYLNTLTVGEHTGTHLDAPAHFVAGGATVDTIPPERLVGPGAVIDISGQCAADADYQLTYLDIKRWEAEHGRIPNGAILLVRTGWGEKWNDADAYLNADAEGVLHFPGVSVEAAEHLVKYRHVYGVGIDTLSVDYGPSKDFASHRVFLGKGVYHIENVANLSRLPPTGATIIAAPLPIRGGSGAPCRVFAMVSDPVEQSRGPAGRKYLIEFGWDIPNERTLADAAAAGTPFDGAVFDAEVIGPDGKRERFSWLAFGQRRMSEPDVRRIVRDLKRTPAEFRRRSFMRFNATPGKTDWFEDWSCIFANARAAASVVRQTGLAGLLLDVEQYEGKIFSYAERRGGRSMAEYARQARSRGSQFVRAINGAAPQIDILLTFGYSIAPPHDPHADYALLPPFLDGMFAARSDGTRIIDGYEYSYPFKTRAAFASGRGEILRDSRGRCEVAFGIWLDWNSGKLGWHDAKPSARWFAPTEFERAVRYALEQSDRYVWIYSERLNWWTDEHLPAAYANGLARAKRPNP